MRRKKPKIRTNMLGKPYISYRSNHFKIANSADDAELWTIEDIRTRKFFNLNATATYMFAAYPMTE